MEKHITSQSHSASLSAAIEILWPVGLGMLLLFGTVLFKLLLESDRTKRTQVTRANALFKAFYFGPDLIVLAFSLLVSSHALKSLLDVRNIVSNYGDSFSNYFNTLLIAFGIGFVVVSLLWLATDAGHRNFPLKPATEIATGEDGQSQPVTIYRLQVLRCLFLTRAGRGILLFGNLIGILAVVAYGFFIYYGFVERPPWQ